MPGVKLFSPKAVYNGEPGIAVQETDQDIAVRFLAGDSQAFGELVARYTSAVFNLAYRYTQNRGEAENITQETFLRAWQALPRLSLDRSLKPYLLRIAVNLCHTWAEKHHAARTVDLDGEEENLATGADDVLDRMTEAELRDRLNVAIDQLPPLYRTAVTLRYTEELSYEEIALTLNLPLNTVRTHLRRAKARLRELLEDG
jgi:RNA polymerase sigma-70 factor (ECF subfamily)